MCGCLGPKGSAGLGETAGTNKAGQKCTPVGFEVVLGGGRIVRYLTEREAKAALDSMGGAGTPIPVCR